MTQFTKAFVWRFVLLLFIVQILVGGFLEWIVSGVEEATFWMVPFFVPYAVMAAVIDALVVFLVAGRCFEKVSNTYCYEYPKQPDKWFRNFVLIICAERVIIAVIMFVQAMINISSSGKPELITQEVINDIYNDTGIALVSQPWWEVISHIELRIIACYAIQIIVWATVMYLLLNRLKTKYNEYLYRRPSQNQSADLRSD